MAAPPPPPAAAPPATAAAAELCRSGRDLLARSDLGAYGDLFARLPVIEDPHRRYWAAANLLEQGLSALPGAEGDALVELLVALAAGAVDVLEREPREPKLLGYAGVAFYELWSLEAAEALFSAAGRLDPGIASLERNLEAVRSRQRRLRGSPRAARLHAALPGLERRALAIAGCAQPALGLRLSLCMIVRDEQEMLPRCLASVADAVDELVIVDTGSSDRTVEIAESFGARVFFHEWTGSFARARNVSLDAATGDWVLYLDADEVLVREDAPLLRALTGRTWREAFYLAETNHTGELDDGTAVTHNALRVFRNRPEYRFEGRLHEQIARRLPGYLPERVQASGVRIDHYGYLGAVRDSREKSRRNIELLCLEQAESQPSAFLHFNLGSEYAAAGRPEEALAELERAWELLHADGRLGQGAGQEFAPVLTSRLVKALRACGRPEDAIERAEQGLGAFPAFTDLVFEQALCALALGRGERAVELLERCLQMGDAPARYTATVGCGGYLPLAQLAALKRSEGDLTGTIELLERCLREYPGYVGSVLPYAGALLAHGLDAEAVLARVERYLPDPSAAARFMLGTALYEAGASAAGEDQFRAVLALQPHSSRARAALAEALLAQRRYGEAAEQARELAGEPDDPLSPVAARTELFALLASGDAGELAVALRRAGAAAMPEHELDLFRAWGELADAGSTEVVLSERSVASLELVLEALLRVHDFAAFELLLGALERTPLSERERRELLASMYLRRGFLASAAEEWMAVCEREPDARALVGLARVAVARGMNREAREFAEAALARDPDDERAAALLAEAKS